jgi:hypothetical protein
VRRVVDHFANKPTGNRQPSTLSQLKTSRAMIVFAGD